MYVMKGLPEWHQQPLALTEEEIAAPMTVINDFFYSYPLPEFREHIKRLLLMACSDQDCNAAFSIIFCEDVTRLIESCYLLKNEDHGKNNITRGESLKH